MWRIFTISSQDESRNALIDFWRGAAMLCVMLQHNRGLPTDAINFLLAFHMPAFFVLSGYMLSFASSVNRYAVKDYVLKRFTQLMIPYFLFEIVYLLSHLIYYGKEVDVVTTCCSIISCMNLEGACGYRAWFFPCLFVADIAIFMLLKKCDKKYVLAAFAGACFYGSWLITRNNVGALPLALDISFMAIPFMIAGYLGAPVLAFIKNNARQSGWYYFGGAIILAGVCYACSSCNAPFLMFNNTYGHYGLSIVAAVCGCGFLFLIASAVYSVIPLSRKLVTWCGRNTLCLYPLHCLVLNVLFAVGAIVDMPAAVRGLIMFMVCIPLANFITVYLPIMAGRGFKRKARA